MSGRTKTVEQYAEATTEAERAEASQRMMKLLDLDPTWVMTWWAHACHLIALTLPVRDPWMHLHVIDGVVRFKDGTTFDLPNAANDLPTHLPQPTCVPDGPWLATPAMSAMAALDLADDWWDSLEGIDETPTAREYGLKHLRAEVLWSQMEAALDWLVYRRRQYTGVDDPFPVVVKIAMADEIDEIANHDGPPFGRFRALLDSARLHPNAYAEARLGDTTSV